MTPRAFYQDVALPNLTEFENQFADLRAAFNAVAAVDSLAAHLFYWLKIHHPSSTLAKDDSEFRHELGQRHPDFALIRDIAKAQKHVVLNRHKPVINSASQISQQQLGWGEAAWGESRWGGPPQIYVTLNDGTIRAVELLVRSSMAFLDGEMTKLNL